MEDQFVTYEIAAKLKELGFFNDEFTPLGFYSKKYMVTSFAGLTKNDGYEPAPLWQQVIDWLFIEHDIVVSTHRNMDKMFYGFVDSTEHGDKSTFYYEKPEPAREAAILKAIELIAAARP